MAASSKAADEARIAGFEAAYAKMVRDFPPNEDDPEDNGQHRVLEALGRWIAGMRESMERYGRILTNGELEAIDRTGGDRK